ncbi:MAG: hypothetical protein ABI230_11750 [Aestuariivirga sp.]
MKALSIILSLFAFLTGSLAAYFWYKASKVPVVPVYEQLGGSGFEPIGGSQMDWIVGLLQATHESARLNKIAAIFTAVSVFSGSLMSALSLLIS